MNRLSPRQSAVAVERLREAAHPCGLDDRPDADLLDRFARYADHPAFEALLRRHGPVVLGVCRRLLANPADVEDAFQATFLVLVRKARSVRRGDRLGPWLYGVAFKVASRARARAARLAGRHTGTADMLPDPTSPPEVPDWLPVLDAELSALPAKYREPLVLCELQATTRADAAKALGIPEGTLSSRLSRGRELLRRRLLKHGTLLPAGGLAALFSAHGVGRAAVPLGLFTKTSELAATGAGLAGAVPAGAARLTDEVLRGMFLTKLRAAGAAVVALGLVAAGALAAWPAGEPDQPQKPKPVAKAADAKPQPAKAAAGAVPDRDALQGLWVLEKADAGRKDRGVQELVGKMQFLIAGNVWWVMLPDSSEGVAPMWAALDPAKNPKWLELTNLGPGGEGGKGIYELSGDKLRVCIGEGPDAVRPAEFVADEESHVTVMQFARGKLPPAAGEPPLVGSWVDGDANPGRRPAGSPAPRRIEILDGYLFVLADPGEGKWIGGKYTVDATKNPKWIDVELTGAAGDEKAKHLYGTYEVGADGRLKMAFETTGRRTLRPLELQPARGVMYFDLAPTKEPIARAERVVRETAPAPKPKAEPVGDERVRELIKAGKFDEAESRLRELLAESPSTGLRAAEFRLLLGVCLLERAALAGPDAASLRTRAVGNFEQAVKEADAAEKAGGGGKHAEWVRTQAELRTLRVFLQDQKPDELLKAAVPLAAKHRDTVEGLIVLSLIYHAYEQKNVTLWAMETRDKMKVLFDKLKDKPGAFTATSGEDSRAYWEKVWFAEGK